MVLAAEFLAALIAARGLGAGEFGRLTLVWSIVGVAHLVVDVRAWEAVTRYLSEFTSRGQTGVALATLQLAVLLEAAVAALGLGLVWIASSWIATRLFADPSLGPLMALGAATLGVSAFDRTARAVLRVFDRFRALGFCSAVESVSRLAIVVAAVGAGARARGVLIAHLAADVVGALMLLALAGREVRSELWPAHASASLRAVAPYRREMLAFLGHSSIRATLKVATRRLDLVLLGYFRTAAEVGIYGAALRLARILEDLSDPLYFAAFPQLARAWLGNRGEFLRLLRQMAGGLGALTAAVVLLGATGAPGLVGLALGPGYADAVAPFRLLLLATGIAVATLWATPAMLASSQPGVATAAATAGAVSLVLLLPGLASAWGATGAGWARVGGGLAYLAVVLWWLARVGRGAPRAERA